MIDFGQITGFDRDEGNRSKSVNKHSVSQVEAEQVFANRPLLLLHDHEHSMREKRYHAYGKTYEERLLQVSFTLRQNDTLIRVVSSRPMSAKERARYAQEKI